MPLEPSLNIYTEDFFFNQRARSGLKKILGKSQRGPQAVLASLLGGLRELGADYNLNREIRRPIQTVCVLSGVKTLDWAIKKKSQGMIGKIIAGPNLVITPNGHRGILKNDAVDRIIVPSLWVKEFYIQQAPEISSKINIWPAGVGIPALADEPKIFDFLVYDKIGQNPLVKDICDYLEKNGYTYRVLIYGKFRQRDYFRLLHQAKYAVYLSESESQGLAMMEAWVRNVPTLVWERGFWQYQNYRWEGQTASPYLSPEAGMRFKDFEEFKKILPQFMLQRYHPRDYAINNFSDRVCAEKFLDIIKD